MQRLYLGIGLLLCSLSSAQSADGDVESEKAAKAAFVGNWRLDWKKSAEATSDEKWATRFDDAISSEFEATFAVREDGTLRSRMVTPFKTTVHDVKWRLLKATDEAIEMRFERDVDDVETVQIKFVDDKLIRLQSLEKGVTVVFMRIRE